ncbi:unnamed protein product [Mesocestoides corti]|uniref:FHA domain-containing protein n=1 Tax=Mesocestoides corti TaxID=53468 RepID=A0A0R3UFH0_MESCO|nr:unnamed protein product [Mesocestoides corti]
MSVNYTKAGDEGETRTLPTVVVGKKHRSRPRELEFSHVLLMCYAKQGTVFIDGEKPAARVNLDQAPLKHSACMHTMVD